ncbi:MAG: GNAT family N-acetyltransferase [Bacillota bacterium]
MLQMVNGCGQRASQGKTALQEKPSDFEWDIAQTGAGTVIIQGPVPWEMLINMNMDDGLKTFRPPYKQKKALEDIASLPTGKVFVALWQDTIVAYMTIHPPDEFQRWSHKSLPQLLELGSIEVSPQWRKYKLASKILHLAFSGGRFEDNIIITNEFVWHWDLKTTGLTVWQYRSLMEKLFNAVGFVTCATDDPDIMSHAANIFSVKIGQNVSSEAVNKFQELCILGE